MRLAKFVKQPNEVKDYDVDYSPWLDPMNDTLNEMAVFVECMTDPDLHDLICFDFMHTESIGKVWLEGGTDGYRYKVTIQMHSVEGRLDESELIFTIKDY